MTDKETSALIETLKANDEELLKQVAILTEQVEYLNKKLYGKSSEKNVVNTNQLSLFDESKAGGEDDEDLPSHYRNFYLICYLLIYGLVLTCVFLQYPLEYYVGRLA